MARDIEKEIQRRIEDFTQEISALVRESAIEAMQEALGGVTARRGRPPGRKSTAKPAAAKTAKASKPAAKKTRRKRGGKRTAAQLQKLEDDFLKEVKSAGGRRVEEIGKVLGVSTKDLALPVKKLMSDKKIKTTGQRRATRYFAR